MTRRGKLLSSTAIPADIGFITQVMESLLEADDTISGFTLFTPDGDVRFIDAEQLRWCGLA